MVPLALAKTIGNIIAHELPPIPFNIWAAIGKVGSGGNTDQFGAGDITHRWNHRLNKMTKKFYIRHKTGFGYNFSEPSARTIQLELQPLY